MNLPDPINVFTWMLLMAIGIVALAVAVRVAIWLVIGAGP